MKKLAVLVLLACFALPQLAFAGAWTLPKNNVWLEYSMKANWSKEDFNSSYDRGRKAKNARSWGWSLNPKMEYGVTDWLTILGGVEYKEAKYKEYGRPPAWGPYRVKSHAAPTVDFGARVRLQEKPFVFSIQARAFIYTGWGQDENPRLSDGSDGYELRWMIGKVWDDRKIPFYIGLEQGYRFYNREVANQIPIFVEAGFWPTKWLLIKSEVDAIICHDSTGNVEKDYAIWRIGPSFQLLDLYDALTGRSISSGSVTSDVTRSDKSLNLDIQYGYWFWGRNVAADQELVAKISTQF
ncbi:MAG: hypothetical protein PHH49_05835 [Candidatus Omnitrophica bacterium]|nr:hypothetical protein [Candidatus Omnitrophota bacterium]MDD5488462.1 hypothetical protein [Candidatus Omnitrophota bacterium]